MKTKLILTVLSLALMCVLTKPGNTSAQSPAQSTGKKPNILVIWGDDIGYWVTPQAARLEQIAC